MRKYLVFSIICSNTSHFKNYLENKITEMVEGLVLPQIREIISEFESAKMLILTEDIGYKLTFSTKEIVASEIRKTSSYMSRELSELLAEIILDERQWFKDEKFFKGEKVSLYNRLSFDKFLGDSDGIVYKTEKLKNLEKEIL